MTEQSAADLDPIETQEWLESLDSVVKQEGKERAVYLLDALFRYANKHKLTAHFKGTTPYCNTIPPEEEAQMPGDRALEQRIRVLMRWNAMATVVRAQQVDSSLGGHIGTFASSATLYDVGFNHFWRGLDHPTGSDLIYIQGHASPGIYARSYLMGEISDNQLVNFRREVDKEGLSSYPHPWLMPEYWQFPTVSMGLGPMQAVYTARFMKYLSARGLVPASDRKVWCFCGDGEMDEPESTAALSIAAREKLDNLIFVVNCNLQRLDGPVRGNGKIIQELEAIFRGAGWHVIKTIWGGLWDPLFAKDEQGVMQQRMDEAVDGDYQSYKAKGGAFTRDYFFGKYPELKEMVAHLSDEDIWRLNRGGHDPEKVYAAYRKATEHKEQPVVILAKTVKGYGLGAAGEAKNTAHNTKKLSEKDVFAFRDRFNIPISDADVPKVPFYRPNADSPEVKYLLERRKTLGGPLPKRRTKSDETLAMPKLDKFKSHCESTGDREISTTMAFVRILSQLVKDKEFGKRIVPIVPDEARTFGMEGLFRQIGIYATFGQQYTPEDADQVMYYKEAENGQILEEGINEAGAFCSWMAAATSYSTNNYAMIPFYIYYSMFGFQRIGDFAWAAGDMRARGFLLGGTAGRTTLNGEGLQHQDGHSHLLASTIPNCISYDPTFSYELAVIIQSGMERMIENQEDVYFYITLMNENYTHPALPEGVENGILKGMYRYQQSKLKDNKIQLLGSGAILREVIAAASLLETEFNIAADVWSVTSFNELRRDGMQVDHHNQMHPEQSPQISYVEKTLKDTKGPILAATDYMRIQADQIRPWVKERDYVVLGTDGFGRSDTRERLRAHFGVDQYHIAYNALVALNMDKKVLTRFKEKYPIQTEQPFSLHA
jgi:pyruvate dehydrogenase E1 component